MAASLEVMQWKSRSLPTIDCCTEATIAEEEAFNREKRLPAEALIEFMFERLFTKIVPNQIWNQGKSEHRIQFIFENLRNTKISTTIVVHLY